MWSLNEGSFLNQKRQLNDKHIWGSGCARNIKLILRARCESFGETDISQSTTMEILSQFWVTAPRCAVWTSSTQETAPNLQHTCWWVFECRSTQFSYALWQMAGKQAGLLEKTNAFSNLMKICFPFVTSIHLFFFVQPTYVSFSYFSFVLCFLLYN